MSTELTIAQKHAQNIRDYWASRGHKVKVWIVREADGRDAFYEIKSDLIDGLPQGMKA